MDNIRPPSPSPEETLIITRELREDVVLHEQQLEKIMAHLQQQSEQVSSGWMPSKGKEGVVESIQPSPKIRKVEALHTKSHDIVGRLRATWLGRLYISHLKQYVVVQLIAHWIWRTGYPVYVNYIASRLFKKKEKRWRPLIKLSEFAKKSGIPIYKLTDAAVVETPEPKVFPTCDQSYLKAPHDRFRFPEIYVATINNAITYGGTNFILADGEVVCHDLYDFERDYTSEELHGRTLIDPKSARIRWLLHDEAPEPIPMAATFVDACAPNYAHWITEVFPRIVLFCADDRFSGVPIVVNDGLHKNIMESLFLVAGEDRAIITLPIGRALAVAELYLTSVAGYVPFERRTNKCSDHSHGLFSPGAFELLRNHLIGIGWDAELAVWPEKIYLRRNSDVRKVENALEIENLLVARGYVIVEPERLSFLEQVRLFSNAKTIFASSGAALANIIFCQPSVKIYIFISKYENTSYWYWQSMACASGKLINYVFGVVTSKNNQEIHANFSISCSEVEGIIERDHEQLNSPHFIH